MRPAERGQPVGLGGGSSGSLGSHSILISNAEVAGQRTDVLVADGLIISVTPHREGGWGPPSDEIARPDEEFKAEGGALLPGLHDHHVHLLSLAARSRSIDLTQHIPGRSLEGALMHADQTYDRGAPDGWMRVVGYHESMGVIDRWSLDKLNLDHPVRLQHRSGAMWVLDSRGADLVSLDEVDLAGIERSADGRATGRLFGLDRWLADRVSGDAPDVFAAAARLHTFGVTGVTDLTPITDVAHARPLLEAARAGLALRIMVSPASELAPNTPEWSPLMLGPVKVYLADHALPDYSEVCAAIENAHLARRCVAVHSVSLASLALALAAWHEVGSRPGDRLEHGSMLPDSILGDLALLGLTVVTQPNFIAERGDDYLRDLSAEEIPLLYRCRSLIDAGVDVAMGTDAPFGDPDPWRAVQAAVHRRTTAGITIGPSEAIPARLALSMLLSEPAAPAGPCRSVAPGTPADLCLLDRGLSAAMAEPSSGHVRATFVGGNLVMTRP